MHGTNQLDTYLRSRRKPDRLRSNQIRSIDSLAVDAE